MLALAKFSGVLYELFGRGPEETCFEGGVFPAELQFPTDYPLSPPKMKFTCDIFHPNSKYSLLKVYPRRQKHFIVICHVTLVKRNKL